jgi:aconitate hydratase
MTQKVLTGRSDDQSLGSDLVRVKVDQVVLARDPNRTLTEALHFGLRKCAVEVGAAYDACCVTDASTVTGGVESAPMRLALQAGVLVARPGIGFPSAVHLERFGSPARLAVTDDPRMASVGGIAMLTLVASPAQLADALITGSIVLRPPRSVQVLLSGRMRPFVCVRDVALELIRRGLGEAIQRVDREHGAPVVIEFAGPSARLLSVPERAVLCALAPQLGASAGVFLSDEKTEVYLRDQRRSKAHRGLSPDPGAPCDEVVSVDLSAVDPLVLDARHNVRQVRELAGEPVHQVVLGGDSGASLRDLLAAAALLKSKRVPPRLDFLVAPPSRQALEVMAQCGALVDLLATGARLVEPDLRLVTGELYPPPASGLSLRTFDPEPTPPAGQSFLVASAETVAFAVATGELGDPRSFKRPVRVTVPRALPTDDVLILRKAKSKQKSEGDGPKASALRPAAREEWKNGSTLQLVAARKRPLEPSALLLHSLEDVRWAARDAAFLGPNVRAVIAPHIPAGTVPVFAGLGILALTAEPDALRRLQDRPALGLPAPETWDGNASITLSEDGKGDIELSWRAIGVERQWTVAGAALTSPPQLKKPT